MKKERSKKAVFGVLAVVLVAFMAMALPAWARIPI